MNFIGKKILIAVGVLSVGAVVPAFAVNQVTSSSNNNADIQAVAAQTKKLQQQIEELQQKISDMQGKITSSKPAP